MSDRLLREREAFRAFRQFLQRFNEREKSEAIELLIGWMEEGSWPQFPLETRDPAQWHDSVKSVDELVGQDGVRAELRQLGSSALAPERLDQFRPSLNDYFGVLVDVVAGPAGGGEGGDLWPYCRSRG
jgi:hypothetical protein